MENNKLLDLYSEDFGYSSVWEDICDSLGVDYNKTDKVTICYNKVITNKKGIIKWRNIIVMKF